MEHPALRCRIEGSPREKRIMKSLLNKTAARSRIKHAWDSIRHRPESKGMDEQTIQNFERGLKANLDTIRRDLLAGKYQFSKLRGLPLKQGAKIRPLRIPAVRDRVVQKAIELTIVPHIKGKYRIENPTSFAYIKGRSVKEAAERIRDLYRDGNEWVYEADIKKFFDSVDRGKLLGDFIFPALPDDTINGIISAALDAELGNAEELERAGMLKEFPGGSEGIPQGGILSPLFANVYLVPLDEAMIKGGKRMVRYADDFVVMCKTEKEAADADRLARAVVEGELDLEIYPLNPGPGDKKRSRICRFQDVEFLGLLFQGDKISPGPKALKKMVATIKDIPREYRASDLASALHSIRSRILTWGANYYYTDVSEQVSASIDQHLVSALRSMINDFGLKPVSKKFGAGNLMRLGVPSFSKSLERARERHKPIDFDKNAR